MRRFADGWQLLNEAFGHGRERMALEVWRKRGSKDGAWWGEILRYEIIKVRVRLIAAHNILIR